MHAIAVTMVGSYPKPPGEGEPFHLRKSLQARDRGEATAEDVRAAEDDLVRDLVAEQAAAGVDVVTDGQVRWDDGQTVLAAGLEGFAIGGLIRYFDNNTYYRQPVVKGEIVWREPILVEDLRFARSVSPKPVKAVLTGPCTMAALCRDEHYHDQRALVRDLAAALAAEARELAAAGAAVVQFDEPALARIHGRSAIDASLLAQAAPTLTEGVGRAGTKTQIQTYFGDVAAVGPALFDLPFDIVGLDLVAGPANGDLLRDLPPNRELAAGVVDGRNTRLERLEELTAEIAGLAELVGPDRLWVSPSCGLEFLPREAAERKCRRLAEAAAAARGASA